MARRNTRRNRPGGAQGPLDPHPNNPQPGDTGPIVPSQPGAPNNPWNTGWNGAGGIGTPSGAPGAPAGMSHLAELLSQGTLPDRFNGGFNIAGNGKIVDTTAGMATGEHAAQYQKLFNAAQQAGLHITGDSGTGGAYDPTILYARGGDHQGYVDMRTGIANPTSTGASALAETAINPSVLQRLRGLAGYNEEAARASAANLGVNDRYPYIPYTPGGQGQGAATMPTGGWPMGSLPPTAPPTAPPATAPATPTSWDTGWGGANPPGTNFNLNPAGQPQVAGGPSTAGSTATGQSNERPKVAYGAQGNKMGVPKDQQRRNLPGGPGQPGTPQGSPGAPGGASGGVQNFLPSTPEFEHGQGGLEDQLAAQLAQIGVAREQIPAYLAMMSGRSGTDQTYDTQTLMGDMTGRGIYDSGITPFLNTRDIGVPYGRQAQDLALGAAGQYSDLATQEGGAYLNYDQGMMDLLLQRALQVSQQMPLSVSQYKPERNRRARRNQRRNN